MNRRISFVSMACAVAVAVVSDVHAEKKITARDIMERVVANTKLAGAEQVATLTIKDGKGNVRERKFSSATKNFPKENMKKSIMRFISPADVKGTGFLTFDYDKKDDDMWLYMPALRKTRRIVSSEKGKSFMGSEFTNSDINMPNLDEYKLHLLGTAEHDGVECWKVEMLPVSDDIAEDYGYSKLVHWVGKDDYVTHHTTYYDLDGELLKELSASNVKLIDKTNNKNMPLLIEIANKQNNRSSIFTVDKIVFNPEVKDEYFTTSYLEK